MQCEILDKILDKTLEQQRKDTRKPDKIQIRVEVYLKVEISRFRYRTVVMDNAALQEAGKGQGQSLCTIFATFLHV